MTEIRPLKILSMSACFENFKLKKKRSGFFGFPLGLEQCCIEQKLFISLSYIALSNFRFLKQTVSSEFGLLFS